VNYLIVNTLNNNKYSVIENNKKFLVKLGFAKLICNHPKYVSKTDKNCHSSASNTDWLVGTRKLAVISEISRESGAGAIIRKSRVVKINVGFRKLTS